MYSSRVLLLLVVFLAVNTYAVPTKRELKQAKIVRAEHVGKRQDDPDYQPKPSKHYKARAAEATPDYYPKPSKQYKARAAEATDYYPKPSKQYKARAPAPTADAEFDEFDLD